MAKAKLRVETGRSTDQLSVRILDDVSGMCLASFSLDPKELWSFQGGSQVRVDGTHTDHFDRVGKQMEADSEEYGREALKASTYDQMVNDAEQMARADRPGWDQYDGRRTNRGSVYVALRRWR